MRVLIVEDNPETVKGIQAHCEDKGWQVQTCPFDDFLTYISDASPDVVVLDWKDDVQEDSPGEEVLNAIWNDGFKPVIIFSAVAHTITLDTSYKSSNLIRIQPKGDEEPVIDYLNNISPFIPVITGLKTEFNTALIHALNSIEMMNGANPLTENVMRYVFARRVSNYFDSECAEAAPPPWIQYTYPAIAKTLCVCDIIRRMPSQENRAKIGTPEEYKVVLTPSCDIAQGHVTHALCANCYPKEVYHKYELRANPSASQIKAITNNLNTGYNISLVALPNIPSILPYMTVDLKKTEFIPLEKIALSKNQFTDGIHSHYRTASVDSPFREQIVWAHLINSCRPGMPNRDVEFWAKEIMSP